LYKLLYTPLVRRLHLVHFHRRYPFELLKVTSYTWKSTFFVLSKFILWTITSCFSKIASKGKTRQHDKKKRTLYRSLLIDNLSESCSVKLCDQRYSLSRCIVGYFLHRSPSCFLGVVLYKVVLFELGKLTRDKMLRNVTRRLLSPGFVRAVPALGKWFLWNSLL
jgi:hypothetical protein